MRLNAPSRLPRLIESVVRRDFAFGLDSKAYGQCDKSMVGLQEVHARLRLLAEPGLEKVSSSMMLGVCGTVSPNTALGAALGYERARFMLRDNATAGDVFARAMVGSAIQQVEALGGTGISCVLAGVLAVADIGRVSPDKKLLAFGHLYASLSEKGQKHAAEFSEGLFGSLPTPKKTLRGYVQELCAQTAPERLSATLRDGLLLLRPHSATLVEEGIKAAPAQNRANLRRALRIADIEANRYQSNRGNLISTLELIREELSAPEETQWA